MPIKLNGSTSGSVELDVPAAVSGGDISLTLPNGVGTLNSGESAWLTIDTNGAYVEFDAEL